MSGKCYYCQIPGDFEMYRNPEDGKSRSTCSRCKTGIAAEQRKKLLLGTVRYLSLPLLFVSAITVLLFGNWPMGVLLSVIAAMAAGLEMANAP